MRRRCSLCGGKLVNHVCVDCGLDNTKNDDQYTFGKSSCESQPMTHVHTGQEDSLEEKTMTKAARHKEEMRMKSYRPASTTWGKGKPNQMKNASKRIVTVIALVFTIGGIVLPWIKGRLQKFQEVNTEAWVTEEPAEAAIDFNPYDMVTRELAEDGEAYSVSLSPGLYKCGVHIPEGRYRLTLEEGVGEFRVRDKENNISLYLNYDTDEEISERSYEDDVRLYKGSLIEIEDNLTLRLESENAQMELSSMPNPNTESKTLEEKFTAGVDIPAGVYDVYCEEGSGIFEYYIPQEGYASYEGKLIGDSQSAFPELYKNIVLPEGVEVTIQGMKVTLKPSEIIESENYADFYPAI